VPSYSYLCEKCGNKEHVLCPRSEAPKELSCQCGAIMARCLGESTGDNISSKEPPSKTQKLKQNLKAREDKIKKLDLKEQEQFRTWSRKQTGGRW